MLSIEWILVYILLGLFVGFMGGLLGVGGGGILVPLLTLSFVYQGFPASNVIHLALGTSLASMIFSSLASTRAHTRRGTVAWNIAYKLATGVLVSVFIVTRLALHVNSRYLALFFAFFMPLISVQMFMSWQPKVSQRPITSSGLFLAGTLIGAVSSLAAVGGGILTVMYLSARSMDMKNAVGTSAAIGVAISIAGTGAYITNGWSNTLHAPLTLGFIYVPAFVLISIASSLAAPYGVIWSHRLPEPHLRKLFALLCLILSARMLFSITSA